MTAPEKRCPGSGERVDPGVIVDGVAVAPCPTCGRTVLVLTAWVACAAWNTLDDHERPNDREPATTIADGLAR